MMKKLLAIACACLCLSLAVTAYAENDGDASVDNTVSQETVVSTDETTPEDETVGENEEVSSEGDETTSDETASDETVSESQSEVSSAEPVESTLPTATPRVDEDGYNVVDEKDVIVNYASSAEELPKIGALIWSICGVLLAGCAILFIYKFVKWRQSK